jgi:hypothetical protein
MAGALPPHLVEADLQLNGTLGVPVLRNDRAEVPLGFNETRVPTDLWAPPPTDGSPSVSLVDRLSQALSTPDCACADHRRRLCGFRYRALVSAFWRLWALVTSFPWVLTILRGG